MQQASSLQGGSHGGAAAVVQSAAGVGRAQADSPAGSQSSPRQGSPVAKDPLPGFRPERPELLQPYCGLGALLADAPVPMAVLQRLWQLGSAAEAAQVAGALAAEGVLRLATLADGSTWGLVDAQHRAHIEACWPGSVQAAHALLVRCYLEEAEAEQRQQQQQRQAVAQRTPFAGVRDDGYIMKALPHHLLGAGQADALCELLSDLAWLETKVYAYGVGELVADFRKCLKQLQQQQQQPRQSDAIAGTATEGGSHMVQLLLQAMQLSLSSASKHPKVAMLREQMLARLLAVSATSLRFKVWHEGQSARCAADRADEADKRPRHLMAKCASLQQAGGAHRMTLRSARSAAMRRALLLPNSPNNVITTCASGMAQLWELRVGDCVAELLCNSALSAEAVSPDGTLVVLGAQDGSGCVWDLAAGRASYMLRGHRARINVVAVDKQGIRCVTGSEDGTARVWSMWGGACEAVLAGHGGPGGAGGAVLGVAISSDGVLCVTASEDFSARVWGLDEDGECLRTLEGHAGWVTACAFVGTSHDVITASHDMTARLWDAVTGRCVRVLEGHTGRINALALDSGGRVAVTCSDDATARLWDAETGECLRVLEGHEGHVADAAVSRDGKTVVTVSGDGRAGVWDAASGSRRCWLEGHSGEVTSVALAPHQQHPGCTLAITCSTDGTSCVWDLDATPLPVPACHTSRVSGLQALPGGRLVVSAGDDGRVLTWEVASGACLRQHDGHGAGVRFLRVAADGRHVVTGSGDRKVCKWNWEAYQRCAASTRSGMETQELFLRSALGTVTSGGGALATRQSLGSVTGGGEHDALAYGRGSQASGRPSMDTLGEEQQLLNALMTVGLTPPLLPAKQQQQPGASQASASSAAAPVIPKTVSMVSVAGHAMYDTCSTSLSNTPANLQPTAGLLAALQADPLRSTLPAQQGSRVKSMAFDAACRLAAVLLFDSTVGVWDLDSGACLRQIIKRGERDASRTHSGGVNGVYLTPDGSRLVTVSKDCTARVWDVASGATLHVVQGHTDGLTVADISPDQALLATAAFDRSVRISCLGPPAAGSQQASVGTQSLVPRAVPRGAVLAVLDHATAATHLTFSPDGRRLAVALEDNTAVVWDLKERRCLAPLAEHTATINALAWSPDGRVLVTASEDCTLRAWRAKDGNALALFVADAAITSCCCCTGAGAGAGDASFSTIVAGDAKGAVHFLDVPADLQC